MDELFDFDDDERDCVEFMEQAEIDYEDYYDDFDFEQ